MHDIATSNPPPRAKFSIAATHGLLPPSTYWHRIALKSPTSFDGFPCVDFLSCVMSKPPLNFPPAPWMTIARTFEFACASFTARSSPSSTGTASAFTGGLFSSITATPSSIFVVTGDIIPGFRFGTDYRRRRSRAGAFEVARRCEGAKGGHTRDRSSSARREASNVVEWRCFDGRRQLRSHGVGDATGDWSDGTASDGMRVTASRTAI